MLGAGKRKEGEGSFAGVWGVRIVCRRERSRRVCFVAGCEL